jgi:hypothetical protein
MLTLKFNDTNDHAEHDWLVLDNGEFAAGFASSNAAERFILAVEASIAKALFEKARAARAAREATRVNGRLP